MTIDYEYFQKSGAGGPPPQFPLFDTSASQLDVWGRCDRRFYYRYVLGLVPLSVDDNLQWGTLWHRVIQEYYTSIKNRAREDAALHNAQLIAERTTLIENKFHGNTTITLDENQRERLWDTVMYYYEQVACMDDWDEIVSVEDQIYFVVGYQNQPVMRVRSTMDLIARKDKRLCVVDHKTTGDVQKNLAFLTLDKQIRIYAITAFAYYEESPMFCYNMIGRDVPPGYRGRSLLTETGRKRSVETLANMQNPANYLHREWKTFTQEQFNAIQRELVQNALTIHFEGNAGIWPRRVIKMGGMACDSCPYFSICGAEYDGQHFDADSPLLKMAYSQDPNVVPPKPHLRLV